MLKFGFGAVLSGLATLLGAGNGLAQDGLKWLQQQQRLRSTQAFDGVVVYAHDGRIDAVRVQHRPVPDLSLYANLGGDRREILRQGDQIKAQLAGVTVNAWPAFAAIAEQELDQLADRYRVREIGSDQVAGLDAVVVQAEPLDAQRFAQRLWFDRQSGLLVGTVVLDHRRQPLEQIMFTSLTLTQPLLANPAANARMATTSSVPLALPDGFAFVAERKDTLNQRHQFLISDGLATVSFYREVSERNAEGDFASRRGAVNLYGRQSAAERLVAIGNVPLPTLRELIERNQ